MGFRPHQTRINTSEFQPQSHDLMSLSALIDAYKISPSSFRWDPYPSILLCGISSQETVSKPYPYLPTAFALNPPDRPPSTWCKRNTATRLTHVFGGNGHLGNSVVTSSPCAFSARGYCMTTCTSPTFFVLLPHPTPFLLSIDPFPV
jgi:hypothetical protein